MISWVVLISAPVPAEGQLTRVVRIGELDGPPEYTFGRIAGIASYPDGRVLVLDQLARRLRVYTPGGEHLFSFGRQGGGPGEFEAAIAPVISGDEILVYDPNQHRLIRFTLGGEHIETRAVDARGSVLGRLAPVRFDQWIGQQGSFAPGDMAALARGDPDPETFGRQALLLLTGRPPVVADTLAWIRGGSVWWHEVGGGSFGPLPRSLPPEDLWAVDGDSLLVTVDAVRGRVRWLRVAAGALEPIGERDLGLEPRPLDEAALGFEAFVRDTRDVADDIEFLTPRWAPYFDQAIVGDDGAVWLALEDEAVADRVVGDPPVADRVGADRAVADRVGADRAGADRPLTYLVVPRGVAEIREITMPLRFRPVVFRAGRIWGIGVDEFDVAYVEAYEYR